MNTRKYSWLLYLITFTVIATITVQVYWNYKNYQQNKKHVQNELQLSLDNAIEEYFADIAKNDFLTLETKYIATDSTLFSYKKEGKKRKITNSSLSNGIISISEKRKKNHNFKFKPSQIEILKKNKTTKNIKLIRNLKSILISINSDYIDYKKLDSLVKKQLKSKNIQLPYKGIVHARVDKTIYTSGKFDWKDNKIDSIQEGEKILFNWNKKKSDTLLTKNINWKSVSSNSTFLKTNEQLKLIYGDTSLEALKRSSTGVLLSLLLSLTIISSLFYLLKIIKKQKQLAEIKNDLISNITHEFKTPITTVSAAIEAINTFNAIDDKEKTKKYLSISSFQLKKLHQMVEKLLETATLDSEKLMLQKEEVDVVELVKKIASKNELHSGEKNIHFVSSKEKLVVTLDPFHFENAISNLIDNAIKYGGNEIEVHINNVLETLEITVADNGNEIEKNQRDKIFDKFYRIPKGNTHNVKGFGIGLYYTKKIIEKHKGEILLIPNSSNTIFKITLPI